MSRCCGRHVPRKLYGITRCPRCLRILFVVLK